MYVQIYGMQLSTYS